MGMKRPLGRWMRRSTGPLACAALLALTALARGGAAVPGGRPAGAPAVLAAHAPASLPEAAPARSTAVPCPPAAVGDAQSSVITGCLRHRGLPPEGAWVWAGWVDGSGALQVTEQLSLSETGAFAFRVYGTGGNIPGSYGLRIQWVRPGTTAPLQAEVLRELTEVGQTVHLGVLEMERDLFPASTPTAFPEEGFFYVVQPGDWLVKLARRFYGDARLWRLIYDANLGLICTCPNRLQPGMRLFMPPPSRQGVPSGGGLIYTVQPGDYLIVLARRFYGHPARYTTILEANRSVILPAGGLRPGMQLWIPPLDSPEILLREHPIIIP